MTNHAHGHEAEKVAARYLEKHGYTVREMNWRHARAEIDIVAQKKRGLLTFFEVKYRETDRQGGGLEYVTPGKLRQMQFAAELWVTTHEYAWPYTLGAIELSGADYAVTAFLPDIM